jgi:hypothetical protein
MGSFAMLHEIVDLAAWKATFPLENLRGRARQYVLDRQARNPGSYPNQEAIERHIALMQPGGAIVCDPYRLAVVEQIRAEVAATHSLGPPITTDVVLFREGEPSKREVTKAGGLPYWPSNKQWPRAVDGRLMRFVAQFCFLDSRDITCQLPGDIMVIFEAGNYLSDWDGSDPSALRCEWLSFGHDALIERMPMREEDCYPASYGALHRTADYPEARSAFDNYKSPWNLAVLEGTKIGGIPRWIQSAEELPGRFLCALGGGRYATTDTEREAALGPWNRGGPPDWGDMGSIYFFIDSQNQIHWTVQCY